MNSEFEKELHKRCLTVDGFRKWYEKQEFLSELVFTPADPSDAEAILNLYRSHLGREFCAWTDDYPSAETINFDLSRNALFCLKTKTGHDLAGVISFDADPETDLLPCWADSLKPSVEFAYRKLRFPTVGECMYHGVEYWCCEKEI